MVVLSASLLNVKSQKVLLSRQYLKTEIDTKIDLFFKLISTITDRNSNFIDHQDIRLLFHSYESIYLLLITDLSSNMFSDLDTLRLFTRTVNEVVFPDSVSEKAVIEKCFPILYAFDELVSFGVSEDVTLDFIKSALKMHSEAEEMAKIALKNQEREAKEIAKRKEREISLLEQKRHVVEVGGKHRHGKEGKDSTKEKFKSMTNSFLDSMFGVKIDFGSLSLVNERETTPQTNIGSVSSNAFKTTTPTPYKNVEAQTQPKHKNSSNINTLDIFSMPADLAPVGASHVNYANYEESNTELVNQNLEDFVLEAQESVACSFTKDMNCRRFELSGKLTLTVPHKFKNLIFKSIEFKKCPYMSSSFNIQAHPCLDRAEFIHNNVLRLKEKKQMPKAANISLLKWNAVGESLSESSFNPIKVNIWMESKSVNLVNVILDVELNENENETKKSDYGVDLLRNVQVKFGENQDFASYDVTVVNSSAGSQLKKAVSEEATNLLYSIDFLDGSRRSAELEFNLTLNSVDNVIKSSLLLENMLYPVSVSFESDRIFYLPSRSAAWVTFGGAGQEDVRAEVPVKTQLGAGEYTIV